MHSCHPCFKLSTLQGDKDNGVLSAAHADISHLCDMRIGIPWTFPRFRGGIAAFNQKMAEAFSKAAHYVVCVNWSEQKLEILFTETRQYETSGSPTI